MILYDPSTDDPIKFFKLSCTNAYRRQTWNWCLGGPDGLHLQGVQTAPSWTWVGTAAVGQRGQVTLARVDRQSRVLGSMLREEEEEEEDQQHLPRGAYVV